MSSMKPLEETWPYVEYPEWSITAQEKHRMNHHMVLEAGEELAKAAELQLRDNGRGLAKTRLAEAIRAWRKLVQPGKTVPLEEGDR